MASIGSIALTLKARTEKFSKGMAAARRSMRRFRNSVPGANAVMGKFGALMSGATVLAIGLMVKKQMQAIDSTAKLADRLHIGTEALVGFQHAAEITGSNAAAVGKAFEFLNKSLGEAATGVGEATQGLEALGMEADALTGMTMDKKIDLIADAMSGLATAEDKAFVATKLFGRAGVSLLNFFDEGGAGLRRLRAEAERLGLTFTREMAARVEKANDAMARSRAAVTGLTRELTIQLAPIIEKVADEFTEWATKGDKATKLVQDGIRGTIEVVGTLAGVFKALAGAVLIAGGIIVGTFAKIMWSAAKVQQGLGQIVTLGGLLGDVSWGDDLSDKMMELNDEAQRMKDTGADMFSDGWNGGPRERAMAGLDHLMSKVKKVVASTKTLKKASKKALNVVDEEAKKAALAMKELQRRTAEVNKEFDDYLNSTTPGMVALKEELGEQLALYQKLLELGDWQGAETLREVVAENRADNDLLAKKKKLAEALRKKDGERKKALGEEKKVQRELREELQKRLEDMQAVNKFARERLGIERELAENLKAAGDDAMARALALKLAHQAVEKVNKDEAAHIAKLAAETKKAADAAEKKRQSDEKAARAAEAAAVAAEAQRKAMKQMADITQRFQRIGGGVFGFGRGQVGSGLGNIQGAVNILPAKGGSQGGGKKSHPAEVAAAKAVKKAAAAVHDLSPAMKRAVKQMQRIEGLWRQLTEQVTSMATGTTASVDRMAASTEGAVTSLRTAVQQMEAKVDGFAARMARAGNLGVGGG